MFPVTRVAAALLVAVPLALMPFVAGAATAAAAAPAAAAPAGTSAVGPLPPGLPDGVPDAARMTEPTLPAPPSWPFGETFSRTSGTGRLAGGASFWTDWVYDDHGATNPAGVPLNAMSTTDALAPVQGSFAYPDAKDLNDGADIFRSAVGVDADASYWRVDLQTLTDPTVPLLEWTLDTDSNAATGGSTWPASAGVSSPGIEKALVVSSTHASLVDVASGTSTDLLAAGASLGVDLPSHSFVLRVPRTVLPVTGSWKVRLGAGVADATGTAFSQPVLAAGLPSSAVLGADRLYNVTFRTLAQEPPVYTDATTDALVTAAGNVLETAAPTLGVDGQTRAVTGNFWDEDHQADALAAGDVSDFALGVDWAALAAKPTTPEPLPTGWSVRWYVSTTNLGQGVVADSGAGPGDLRPNYLNRVQPYGVYVPTTYDPAKPAPLTWSLHSLDVNHNQYSAYNPQYLQALCERRGSICATTLGFGPDGWYFDEAETDFWQVWAQLGRTYSLDPERTVLSGYSMGGWATWKLGLSHPDLFAAALVLEGPPICGLQVANGAGGAGGPGHCTDDGASYPFLGNARSLPYDVTQGGVDELVPVTSVLQQMAQMQALGNRYHFELFPTEDHLVYATQDRFDDQVQALATTPRTVDPGHITYGFYPELSVPALGIGTTTAYWTSGLVARTSGPGVTATLDATSAAIADPPVTTSLLGPVALTDPVPGEATDLVWTLGPKPAAAQDLALTLTNLAGITVDTRRAALTCGFSTAVVSDGPSTVTFTDLQPGTTVGGLVTGPDGTVAVPVASGSSTVPSLCPASGPAAPVVVGGAGPVAGAAAVTPALAHTGLGLGLPVLGAVALVGGLAVRRRRA